MKCFTCNMSFASYQKLAEHILSNKDGKHKNPKAIRWANRYIGGIHHTPKRKSPTINRPLAYPNGYLQQAVSVADKCLLCGQPRDKCCC